MAIQTAYQSATSDKAINSFSLVAIFCRYGKDTSSERYGSPRLVVVGDCCSQTNRPQSGSNSVIVPRPLVPYLLLGSVSEKNLFPTFGPNLSAESNISCHVIVTWQTWRWVWISSCYYCSCNVVLLHRSPLLIELSATVLQYCLEKLITVHLL